mgnify:CR=1 FL=1
MLKGYVNASGFPLQIAVAHAVTSTTSSHGWKERFHEHAWHHPTSDRTGFIDLVIVNRHETAALVVECKRTMDSHWVFLKDVATQDDCKRTKCFVLHKNGVETKRFSWVDLAVQPQTFESEFCVVRGTGNGNDKNLVTLLERVGSELVISSESLAIEDKRLSLDDRWKLLVYFNVIVTTATLHVCSIEASDISLKDGTVDEVDLQQVPYVRFRKQLNAMYNVPDVFRVAGDCDVAAAKESTVFVVNSMHLIDFLEAFEIENGFPNAHYLA